MHEDSTLETPDPTVGAFVTGPLGTQVTLDCLGVAVSVPATIAAMCPLLPRTNAPPRATIDDTGPDAIAELTATAVSVTAHLALHAAVVTGPGGTLVVSAASGAGKSTLTAALLRRGFGYVSDEVLAVDRVTGEVTPFSRPLALHASSWDVVPLPAPRPAAGSERFVDAALVGPVSSGPTRVAAVVVLRRRPPDTSGVVLTELSPGEIFSALVPRCFNHYKATVSSLAALRTIATSATGVVADYSDAVTLADTLADRFGLPVGCGTGP